MNCEICEVINKLDLSKSIHELWLCVDKEASPPSESMRPGPRRGPPAHEVTWLRPTSAGAMLRRFVGILLRFCKWNASPISPRDRLAPPRNKSWSEQLCMTVTEISS